MKEKSKNKIFARGVYCDLRNIYIIENSINSLYDSTFEVMQGMDPLILLGICLLLNILVFFLYITSYSKKYKVAGLAILIIDIFLIIYINPLILLGICLLLNIFVFFRYIISYNKRYITAGFALLIIDVLLIIYIIK